MIEKELVHRALKKGDKEAFEELIAKYYNELNTYIAFTIYKKGLQILSLDDTKDILQNTIIKTWSNRDKFTEKGKGPNSSFENWLYKIGRNELFNKLSEVRKQLSIRKLGQKEDRQNILDCIERKQVAEIMKDTINNLDIKCREILWLMFGEQLSSPEVSTRLNISPSVARQRKVRCLKKLKKAFKRKSQL